MPQDIAEKAVAFDFLKFSLVKAINDELKEKAKEEGIRLERLESYSNDIVRQSNKKGIREENVAPETYKDIIKTMSNSELNSTLKNNSIRFKMYESLEPIKQEIENTLVSKQESKNRKSRKLH